MVRTEYEMTKADLEVLLDASKLVPYMVFGGMPPASPQENANRAWSRLGDKMGFDWNTVEPQPHRGDRCFTAAKVAPPPDRTPEPSVDAERVRIEVLADRALEGIAADDRQTSHDYAEAVAAVRELERLAPSAKPTVTEAMVERCAHELARDEWTQHSWSDDEDVPFHWYAVMDDQKARYLRRARHILTATFTEPSVDTDKHTVSILVDCAFIGELDAWSQPVQVRIEQSERGHQLMARAYTAPVASDSAETVRAETLAEVRRIVEAEEEAPGPMPDAMWRLFRSATIGANRDNATQIIRGTIAATKKSILTTLETT